MLIKGNTINGYCRSHEEMYKQECRDKAEAMPRLLKVQGNAFQLKTAGDPESIIELTVSVDGSRFKQDLAQLLFE